MVCICVLCDGNKCVKMAFSIKKSNVCLDFICSTTGDNGKTVWEDNNDAIVQEQEYELVDVEDEKYYRGNNCLEKNHQ